MTQQIEKEIVMYRQGPTITIDIKRNNGIMIFYEELGSHTFADEQTAIDNYEIYTAVTPIETERGALQTLDAWEATTRIRIVCTHCGSEDISRDAEAAWCKENQLWEIQAVYDNITCNNCGRENETKKIPF